MTVLECIDVLSCMVIATAVVERARVMNEAGIIERVALATMGAFAIGCIGEVVVDGYSPMFFGTMFRVGVALHCAVHLLKQHQPQRGGAVMGD